MNRIRVIQNGEVVGSLPPPEGFGEVISYMVLGDRLISIEEIEKDSANWIHRGYLVNPSIICVPFVLVLYWVDDDGSPLGEVPGTLRQSWRMEYFVDDRVGSFRSIPGFKAISPKRIIDLTGVP